MPLTFADAHAIASALPDVTVGTRWNNRTWLRDDHGFMWERPLGKTDLARLGDAPPPQGDILGVRVADLDAKDALLAIGLPGFFTIQHFNGFPAVLVELRRARKADLRAAIHEAYAVFENAKPKRAAKPRAKPAAKATPATTARSAAKARPAAKTKATKVARPRRAR